MSCVHGHHFDAGNSAKEVEAKTIQMVDDAK
jgi:hypothetical protein